MQITSWGIAGLFLAAQPASAARPSSVELGVKATFLTKFPSYLDWPVRHLPDGAPIIICVIGADPFGSALEKAVAGETISARSLTLRRYASAGDVNKCHIAYLGGSSREVSAALAVAGASPVVTVTDSRNSNINGMIHFQLVGNSVKFDIDTNKSSRAGVGISSKLLGLARKVHRATTR
ncbi:YfiR family protein [Sphingorhabdus sp.]|uniref:YfiR family protein n=1 Tax=Sphingorhabdus sp. TaxID=1902408 RepID=UPI00391DBA30